MENKTEDNNSSPLLGREKRCLNCGIVFQGRPNKIYCGKKCKTIHHNNLASKDRRNKSFFQKKLDDNRSILMKIYSEKVITSKTELQEMGFDFAFATHRVKLDNRTTFFVYEYGFRKGRRGLEIVRYEYDMEESKL